MTGPHRAEGVNVVGERTALPQALGGVLGDAGVLAGVVEPAAVHAERQARAAAAGPRHHRILDRRSRVVDGLELVFAVVRDVEVDVFNVVF